MEALACLIELVFIVFGCWTVAYQVTVLLALPAQLVWFPLAMVWVPTVLVVATRVRSHASLSTSRRPWRMLATTAALSLVTGLFTLVTSRPDMDDVSFFHRALIQVSQLDRPFVTSFTSSDIAGLPQISGLHALTSYEPLMAIAGWELCGDPLWFYQNMGAFLAAVLYPAVLVLWFRHLGLRPAIALASAAAAVIFLLCDGNRHHSFGNTSLVRLWQGKCILWTLVAPAGFCFSYRFLRHPTSYRFLVVVMAGVSGVGLSNSASVFYPTLLLCASGAYLLTYGFSRRRLLRALTLNVGSAYCLGWGAVFAAGLLGHTDMSVWRTAFEASWTGNLNLVIGGPWGLGRNILLLNLIPWLVLPRRKSRFLMLYCVMLLATVLNPVTGPWVMTVVTPASYWRFMYLLPVPLCAGLVVCCFLPRPCRFGRFARISGGLLTVAAVTYAYESSSLAECHFKQVSDYKLPENEMILARKSAQHLGSGFVVLAAEDPAWVMSLLDPSLRFPSIRARETIHVFRNGNRTKEGIQRVEAQQLITDGQLAPERLESLRNVLRRGVDAMVVTAQAYPLIEGLLATEGWRWRVAEETSQYSLIVLGHLAADQGTSRTEGRPSAEPRDAATTVPASRSRTLR
jgi:hypothetical protein